MSERRCVGWQEPVWDPVRLRSITDWHCPNPAGSTHSDHWCQPCDDKRLAHISKSLHEMAESFGPTAPEGGPADG